MISHLPTITVFISLVAVFLISVAITGYVRNYALNKAILDIPNERSSHAVPTPRGGGIAIVITFLFSILLLAMHHIIPAHLAWALIGGGIMIAAVGYWDDVHGLSARWRALVHFVAACWALCWLGGFPVVTMGIWHIHWGWLGVPIAILGIMWLTNLYNFMDGIDGFASMEGAFVGLASGIIIWLAGAPNFAWICFLLSAAIAGFLVWNWPPAKIFMGDVGSGTLGFIFAVLLIASSNETQLSPLFWIILLAVFIFDATFTLIRRMRRKEPLYQAHRSHAYQQLIQRGNSHMTVTLGAFMINCLVMLPLSFLIYWRPSWTIPIFMITLVGLWCSWYFITNTERS